MERPHSVRQGLVFAATVGVALLLFPLLVWAEETCPPKPGTVIDQESPSTATLTFQVIGGPSFDLLLQGNVRTLATAVQTGVIETEIISMSLTGQHPALGNIVLTQSKERRSRGMMNGVALHPSPSGGPVCGSVESFFDVFFDISAAGGQIVLPPLHNAVALRLQGRGVVPLDHKKAAFTFVQPGTANPVPVLDPNNRTVGTVNGAVHSVEPPPSCFPAAGIDIMDSNLFHDIDVPGIGLIQGNLSGPIRVQRSDPYVNPTSGLTCIDTEIVSMTLTGIDPVAGTVTMTLDPCRPSKGQICEQVPGTCFPADSFFDVFVMVQLKDLGICFYSCQPARMKTVINSIPPLGAFYNIDLGPGQVLPLYKGPCMDQCVATQDPCRQQPLPAPAAFIIKAVHQPLPPKQCECFPKAGYDVLTTTLVHSMVIPGMQLTCSNFAGPIVVKRSDPYIGADGMCRIDTEIIRMDMTGTCSDGSTAKIRLNPDQPSKGFIQSLQATACFPARSCFDIYFEVEIATKPPIVLRNCKPVIMCCQIAALPPLGCPYAIQNPPIELYAVTAAAPSPCLLPQLPNPMGYLEEAVHTPKEEPPPCCPEYGPGTDVFESNLMHDIDFPGIGRCTANLTGPVKVVRGKPFKNASGICCVDVEMVSLELTGVDPLCGQLRITLDPRRPSRGQICQQSSRACFPATSCFDVFVRVEAVDMGLVLVACEPATMCCTISAIPPYGCLYNLDIGAGNTIPLYKEVAGANVCEILPLPNPTAYIVKAVHQPEPPCKHYPPAGDDTMQSELAHRVRLYGLGPNGGDLICDADMHGPVVVHRQNPEVDPVTGHCLIKTEIVQLSLEGVDPNCGPVKISLNPQRRSLGEIRERTPGTGFPADSFFDVFFDILIPDHGIHLVNCAPVRMSAVIDGIPPYNAFYLLNLSDVLLYRFEQCALLPSPTIKPAGILEDAGHAPRQEDPSCPDFGPGRDVMDSVLRHDINIFGLGKVCDVPLTGQVVVDRGMPYRQTNPDGTTVVCVSTRMVSLDLQGVDPDCGPIRIRLSPDRASRGTICALQPTACFPALSCFDVFIEVEVGGQIYVNCQPVRMCCQISSIPPYDCIYRFQVGTAVLLYAKGSCDDVTHVPVPLGEIRLAEHVTHPCVPENVKCELVTGAAGQVKVSWTVPAACGCDSFTVIRKDAAGNEVPILVPAGATSITDSPCPPGAAGPMLFTYCVRCVSSGVASDPACCEINVPCLCDAAIQSVRCLADPAAGTVKVSWVPAQPLCCASYLVTLPGGGTVTVPGSQTTYEGDCVVGEYCVQCVRRDGTLGPKKCCTVRQCDVPPPPCKFIDVKCEVTPNGIGITWGYENPDCDCAKIVIRNGAGTVLGEVPVGATSAYISGECPTLLGGMSGKICVVCLDPAGAVLAEGCCDAECGALQKPCDCNQDQALDISDAICLLGNLFLGQPPDLPCGNGRTTHSSNIKLMDCNGDTRVDISDGICILSFLFIGTDPPAACEGNNKCPCIRIVDCPRSCPEQP